MKATLLLTALLAATSFCSAQMQRAFYNYESQSFGRTEILAEINNQLVFASIKDQSEDTITVVTGYIDDKGETSNYQSLTIPNVLTGTVFALSGYGVNANNELILAVEAYIDGVVGSTMNYIQINPTNNQVTPIYINPTQMKGAYVRSRQNGDSLVTYYSNSASEFKRMATSLNTITSYSVSTISTGITYSGALNIKKVELLVADNGDEFVSVGTTVFKHTPSNVVTSRDLVGFSNFHGVALCLNPDSNDNLFILHGGSYVELSSSLDSITSGTIAGLSTSNARNVELYYENGKYMILNGNGTFSYNPYVVYSSTYTIQSSANYTSLDYLPHDVLITSNGHYFVGIKSASDGYSTFVSKLEIGIEPEPYIEYGQFLYSANQKINTNHYR